MITEERLVDSIMAGEITPAEGLELLRSDQVQVKRKLPENDNPTWDEVEMEAWHDSGIDGFLFYAGADEAMRDAYSTELARLRREQHG